MPRLKESADLLEDRRKRALALLDAGHSLNEVGRRIGCNASSVMRWRNARRRGGAKALRVRFSPGRPWKLTATQRKRLVRFLLQGPVAHGYRTNLWTTIRIAEIVQRKFGIRYHRAHVGRLMHSLKWTPQKPERRALERDEEKIKRWKQRKLAPGKKNAARLGAHIVFADESGFLLIPSVVRTWAPEGQTPIHRHRQGPRDKISVISGISLSPQRQRLGLYYLSSSTTSSRKKSAFFCARCCGTCAASSLFCWITPPPIRGNRSRNSCSNTCASRSNIFLRTPRNSTPTKECGRSPKGTSPTPALRMSMS